ncbi:MAG: hypothetical protein ACFCVG_09945 [Kineosporiaceae bacterium]
MAGTRWRIEESFQSGKDLTGLDQHQVRTWTSWHRWTALAMLAHAYLSIMTADQPRPATHHPTADDLVPLTRQEIRRLFTSMITDTTTRIIRDLRQVLAWSHWRRRHQARARTAHYDRRARQDQ